MSTSQKRRSTRHRISEPGPPIPVPPEPQPDPGGPVPPLPAPPDPDSEPDRVAQLLRLAELPRAALDGRLAGSGSATIEAGLVRMTRPRARRRAA